MQKLTAEKFHGVPAEFEKVAFRKPPRQRRHVTRLVEKSVLDFRLSLYLPAYVEETRLGGPNRPPPAAAGLARLLHGGAMRQHGQGRGATWGLPTRHIKADCRPEMRIRRAASSSRTKWRR